MSVRLDIVDKVTSNGDGTESVLTRKGGGGIAVVKAGEYAVGDYVFSFDVGSVIPQAYWAEFIGAAAGQPTTEFTVLPATILNPLLGNKPRTLGADYSKRLNVSSSIPEPVPVPEVEATVVANAPEPVPVPPEAPVLPEPPLPPIPQEEAPETDGDPQESKPRRVKKNPENI